MFLENIEHSKSAYSNDCEVLIKTQPGLLGTFTKDANEILLWCFDHEIDINFINKKYEDGMNVSVWNIPDEQQRMLFILKWCK